MPVVFFIRHAESTWNAYGDLSKNVSITTKGKTEQASKVSGKVDLVILSPLKRALETFVYSKLQASQIIVSNLCREVRGGTPCDYLETEDTSYLESEDEIQQRILDFKTYIHELSKTYKTIAIISHFCFIEKITTKRLHNCQVISFDL